jgi:hypothetical protein
MSKTNNVYKYPRTPHLPESQTISSDDKKATPDTLSYLQSGIDLVVSEKLDGGNLTFMREHFYARSLDSGTHLWDTRAKQLHAEIAHEIPNNWRISGESMYARRSVDYDNLPGVFMVFGIWDETNTLLSWDETTEYANMLSLPMVPVLYRGTDYQKAISVWGKTLNDEISEGFVIRDAGKIAYDDFTHKAAKYVRANHVRTDASWRGRDDFDLNTFL